MTSMKYSKKLLEFILLNAEDKVGFVSEILDKYIFN